MKRGLLPSGGEVYTFGTENTLRIFPQNTFNFKPKGHITLDNIQQCILDNFWYQYNNKREDKGYMLSILNSLSEYFNAMNKNLPKSAKIEVQETKSLYVLFDGNRPGIYITFEELIVEKLAARKKNGDITFKKYLDISEALKFAREIIGENYYIEPKAKEYIEKNSPASSKPKEEASSSKKVKNEDSPKYHSYKECLQKGVDPLDGEYIDLKIDEKMEETKNIIKEELKEVILRELQIEFYEKFENLKKEYEFLNDDNYDVNMQDSQIPE